MSERFNPVKAFMRKAPVIETGMGVVGLVGMAGVAIDPKAAREGSQASPVGVDAIAKRGNELGLSDQATFVIVTIFFGAAAMHGFWRLRRRRTTRGS